MSRFPLNGYRSQRGMATLLVVILVGLGMTAISLGVLHSVQGAQDRTTSINAVTQAQQRAWAGVELIRAYLDNLNQTNSSAISSLQGNLQLTHQDGSAVEELKAAIDSNFGITTVDSVLRVPVNITGLAATGTSAQTTATIQVVYALSGGSGGGGSFVQTETINIRRDLVLTGSVNVSGGSNAVFNVDGNVSLSGSVTGIKTIND